MAELHPIIGATAAAVRLVWCGTWNPSDPTTVTSGRGLQLSAASRAACQLVVHASNNQLTRVETRRYRDDDKREGSPE